MKLSCVIYDPLPIGKRIKKWKKERNIHDAILDAPPEQKILWFTSSNYQDLRVTLFSSIIIVL